MKFAVLFEDNEAHANQRAQHMQAHLAFLEANADRIEAAGPLKAQGAGAGGLWLVEAKTAAAVQQLVESDPFWPTGLRKSVRVLEWVQVFRDGARRI
ncbi:hypothetical protein FHS89_002536 [Rubricella aquisinus]|uniref:YCII-related domain-containing protein n=1 Tax=Rubricella aquisinus TaxID=2028108 RepID=A0A840X3U2_9RHOB|nr:YciI family protein [Rubricella aquisinus]MBB5516505.1 hypothetical protein [Rubricella aquisinus]